MFKFDKLDKNYTLSSLNPDLTNILVIENNCILCDVFLNSFIQFKKSLDDNHIDKEYNLKILVKEENPNLVKDLDINIFPTFIIIENNSIKYRTTNILNANGILSKNFFLH